MKKTNSIIFLFIFATTILNAQKTKRAKRINKYSIGLEIATGHSFSLFDKNQDRWATGISPAGAVTALFANKLNQHWIADLGIGASSYFFVNKGPIDNYILDFISPHLIMGMAYYFQHENAPEIFLKLTAGAQLGYQNTLTEKFETYTVFIQSENRFYYFVRPEIGIRKYYNRKKNGVRFKTTFDFGAFFRYHLNSLGTAIFQENDFEATLKPSGNIIGIYFKFLYPAGKKKIKLKEIEDAFFPVIYNPRFL